MLRTGSPRLAPRSLRTAATAATLAGLFVAAASACGDPEPQYLTNSVFSNPNEGSDGGNDAALVIPPLEDPNAKCGGLAPDGTACSCTEVPLSGKPPLLYFVLDASGSMNDDGKWTDVRTTVLDAMQKIGNRARYGMWVYPTPRAASTCAEGTEFLPASDYDKPPGVRGTVWNSVYSKLNATGASGGTPTAAALRAIASRLPAGGSGDAGDGGAAPTFVILATDGAPNCNLDSNCGVDRCVPNLTKAAAECTPTNNCCKAPTYSPGNCIDEDAVPAVSALRRAGVPTFVLGIPGSEVFGDVLDDMAVAGDTVQPGSVTKYYKVGATGPNAIATALRKIAARVVGNCTITLEKTPADPEQVNVFFDGVVVPRDGDNGWRLNDNILTLIGVSCQQVQQGDVLEVRVVAGCPTVTIGK